MANRSCVQALQCRCASACFTRFAAAVGFRKHGFRGRNGRRGARAVVPCPRNGSLSRRRRRLIAAVHTYARTPTRTHAHTRTRTRLHVPARARTHARAPSLAISCTDVFPENHPATSASLRTGLRLRLRRRRRRHRRLHYASADVVSFFPSFPLSAVSSRPSPVHAHSPPYTTTTRAQPPSQPSITSRRLPRNSSCDLAPSALRPYLRDVVFGVPSAVEVESS